MKVIIYKGQKVITTEMLAQAYETDSKNIRMNFMRNEERFILGCHYFKLEGDDLRAFKRDTTNSGFVAPNLNVLYLWTERGANRHSKILDTDKAWEQFENLEQTYFRVKEGTFLLPLNFDLLERLPAATNFLRLQRAIMKDNGHSPDAIAKMDKQFCDYAGIPCPEWFVKAVPFQMTVDGWDRLCLPEESESQQ